MQHQETENTKNGKKKKKKKKKLVTWLQLKNPMP